jgi:hypothetical protein
VRNAAYRESVAREIEKTEQDYVDNLRLLSEVLICTPSCPALLRTLGSCPSVSCAQVFLEPLRKELESKDEALEGFKGVFADIQVCAALWWHDCCRT